MDRDIEILLEIIADNIFLLKNKGDIDIGLYGDICDKFGFDFRDYLYQESKIAGKFRHGLNRQEWIKANNL